MSEVLSIMIMKYISFQFLAHFRDFMDSDWNSEDEEEWKDFDNMMHETKFESPPRKKRLVEKVYQKDVEKLPDFQVEMVFAEELMKMRRRIDDLYLGENIIKGYLHWEQCKAVGILTANTETTRITQIIVTLSEQKHMWTFHEKEFSGTLEYESP